MRPGKDVLPTSTRRRHSKKAITSDSGKGANADFADTLILDFPASRAVRNKFLPFKPPSLWYSVIEALANEYITKVIDRFSAISNAVASVVQIKA